MTATPERIIRFIVGAVATASILFLIWYFSSIVVYILISAVLAIVGRPLVCHLSQLHIRHWRIPRWLAALVTLILIWVVLGTLLSLFVPLVANKIYQLSTLDFSAVMGTIEEPITQAQAYLNTIYSLPEAHFSLSESLISALSGIVNMQAINAALSSIVSIAISTVIAFFSVSFITFFFLKDEGLFYAMVVGLFPSRYTDNVTRALDSITLLLSRYFTGILAESCLVMLVVSLSMMAFGMAAADAFFIGLVMGVMNVVPYAGPLIGGIISIFLGLITPLAGMSIGHTILIITCTLLIIKGLDDFVLQPTLYSERVKAHPLEIFIVILIAGSLAGILGMLLAIPSYTVLRVFAKEFFSQFRVVRQLTDKI
ncbi:MAG: AI-2E family transporter [Alistipes sp.]